MFDCTCNTQNSLLLNQHNGDDVPQDCVVVIFFFVPAFTDNFFHQYSTVTYSICSFFLLKCAKMVLSVVRTDDQNDICFFWC